MILERRVIFDLNHLCYIFILLQYNSCLLFIVSLYTYNHINNVKRHSNIPHSGLIHVIQACITLQILTHELVLHLPVIINAVCISSIKLYFTCELKHLVEETCPRVKLYIQTYCRHKLSERCCFSLSSITLFMLN